MTLPDPKEREQHKAAKEAIQILHDWIPIFCLAIGVGLLFSIAYDVAQDRRCSYSTPAYQFTDPAAPVMSPYGG